MNVLEKEVTVDEIFISNLKPPFFVSKAPPSDSWDNKATVGSLFQQCAELNKELELMVQTCSLYILVSLRTMSQAVTPFIPSNCKAVKGVPQSLSVSLAIELFLLVEGFIWNGAEFLDKTGIKPQQLMIT
jgi:hypothetical protein